jgi:hypothetical protein
MRTKYYRKRVLVIFHVKKTGANVMIQREEKEYAECGRSLTLTCKIQKYVFAMSWLTGKDQIKIARCVENTCDQNPNYFGQYNFTFDVERGVFNLTIVKVTKDDNGRILVCSDGSDVDTRVIKISGKFISILYIIIDLKTFTIFNKTLARNGF